MSQVIFLNLPVADLPAAKPSRSDRFTTPMFTDVTAALHVFSA